MKRALTILLMLASGMMAFSQIDTTSFNRKASDRFVVWFIPSAAKNIYGIAIGPVGSEAVCNRPYTKYSHGLNLQIPGQGLFQVFYMNRVKFSSLSDGDKISPVPNSDTIALRAIHNGVMVSLLGSFTPKVNGLSMSLFMSMGQQINGLSANLLWNLYNNINGVAIGVVNTTGTMKGIQVGIVNKSARLNGVQLGLWNINERRALPVFNWN